MEMSLKYLHKRINLEKAYEYFYDCNSDTEAFNAYNASHLEIINCITNIANHHLFQKACKKSMDKSEI